jgi:hypothetical protein
MVQQILDSHLGKFVSRKLLVWTSATALLLCDKVSGEQWVFLSAIYIGGQAVIDSFLKWKGK